MAIATALAITTGPGKVHLEVPGFQAFGEFHGSNKDCSADAEQMARHPIDGAPLDAATLNLYWSEYWNTGHHTSGGATLAHIYWHLTASAHKLDASHARVARFIDTDKVNLATLHGAIKDALLAGQTVIVYLGNAQALTYNERGVYGHFVALGGIDSDLGYLVGNGDDVNALGGHGIIPCRWYTWAQLVAAQINGCIAIERVGGWPTDTPRQVTLPSDLTWAQIAARYAGGEGNAQWLLDWNGELHSQLWWTVHAGTLINVPQPKPAPAPAPTPTPEPTPAPDPAPTHNPDDLAQIAQLQGQVSALNAQLAAAQSAADPKAKALADAVRAVTAA